MYTYILTIEGMKCGMCEAHINDLIRKEIKSAKKIKSNHKTIIIDTPDLANALEDAVIARDFYGKNLGRYDKKLDVTKDFYGRIISTGNTASALIWNEYNKNKQGQ